MSESAAFVPGLELSRLYYIEAVRPILERNFSSMPHNYATDQHA